jgi:hypothetical protein
MIKFDTSFKNVSAIEINNPDCVVVFDNLRNIVAVFPRGKYPYDFWSDFIFYFVRDIDSHLMQKDIWAKRSFRKLYRKFFCGLRNEELKKAFSVDVEALCGSRGSRSGEPTTSRSHKRDTVK